MTEIDPRTADGADGVGETAPEVIAEQAVLGTAVQSPGGAAEALLTLRPEHFSRSAHRVVFEAVDRLAEAGVPVDHMTVMTELAKSGMLAKVRGPGMGSGGAFLHSLMQHAGSVAYHAPVILAAASRRRVRAALQGAAQAADSPGFLDDPGVYLDQVRKLVVDATSDPAPPDLLTQDQMINEALARLEEDAEPGLSTGLTDLDDLTGGLQDGKMYVVAARPGVGKSVLCLGIADHVAVRLGLPVFFGSLEMSADDIAHRRISAAAKVPLHLLNTRQLAEADWDRFARVRPRLTDSPLLVDVTPGASLARYRGHLARMARTGTPARLAVIDYLGLLAEPKAESRQQSVAALARGCRDLAKEFGIPVLVAAQLNRGPEHRPDKRPTLADLRESGEIEQAADVVILLHRDDAYEPESPRAGEIDLLVRKNRQGPQATITAAFQGHYARIKSMAPAFGPGSDWTPSKHAEDAA